MVEKKKIKVEVFMKQRLELTVSGISLLCLHAWSKKAKRQIAVKQGKESKITKEPRNPRADYDDCFYKDPHNPDKQVVPVIFFKKALINAAHKDIDIPKTIVATSVFFEGDMSRDFSELKATPIPFDDPRTEDPVRIGSGPKGTADLRYRPKFEEWNCTIIAEIYPSEISIEQVVTLFVRAGLRIGVAEGRPQKQSGLDWGRFEVDLSSIKVGDPVEVIPKSKIKKVA